MVGPTTPDQCGQNTGLVCACMYITNIALFCLFFSSLIISLLAPLPQHLVIPLFLLHPPSPFLHCTFLSVDLLQIMLEAQADAERERGQLLANEEALKSQVEQLQSTTSRLQHELQESLRELDNSKRGMLIGKNSYFVCLLSCHFHV